MPLDALCLSGVVHELQNALSGAKIDKIYQPGRDEVVLALRAPAGNVKLLLSASPSHPRAHLTQISRENPDKPPMFCMLLRKHLSGARLLELVQPPMERVVDLRLEALDELGDRVERRLVLEAMGRHSNLILLDGEGRIMDCLRRVDSDMSARRQVLPGLFYRLPPAQEKLDPSSLDRAALESALAAAPEESQADKWLLDTFGGLSPLICRELAFRAGGATDARLHQMGEGGRSRLLDELEGLLRSVQENSFTPVMLEKEGHPSDFTFQPISQYGPAVSCVPFPSFSALLDRFYEQRENQERVRQRGQDLIRSVTNARDRAARKIGLQEQELAATRDRERLRICGELITANLYRMERGMNRLTAENYYEDGCPPMDIPLDVRLGPQENAARYFKQYAKAKTAEKILTEQLGKGREELTYLESVVQELSQAEAEQDFNDIRAELESGGYLKNRGKKQPGFQRASKPRQFVSSAGLRILVGRSNRQNDRLTAKEADRRDIWLHTQKIHGSHVILCTGGQEPDEASLYEAACLAAYYSQGREAGKVPVDYTPVRYVKKPAGARPGMVVYTTYQTMLAVPDGQLVKKLAGK